MRESGSVSARAAWLLAYVVGVVPGCGDDGGSGSTPDAMVGTGTGDGGASGASGVTRVGAEVVIGSDFTACAEHADCTLVGISCNGCCELGAIEASRRAAYEAAHEAACRDYEGGICDCGNPDSVARCQQGMCVSVARSEIADCVSPMENAWRASEDDAVGCACESGDSNACTSEGALACLPTPPTGARSWQAVEDASCVPRKLADAADASDSGAVTVHVFVVPDSGPAVPIEIWLDEVHVVTGSFEYGSPDMDPGRVYEFDVVVAGPTVSVRVEGPEATAEESIEAPAERWLVVSYQLDEVTTPGSVVPRVDLQVSDKPVGFE